MNSDRLSRTSRPYNNALREEQAKHTRQKILDTAVGLMRENAPEGISVPRIAERSGISVATIYRHFPDRDALLDGVDASIGEKLGRPPFPETIEELIAGAPTLFRYYEKASELMRVARDNPALRELNEARRKGRDRMIGTILAELTDGLDPRRANAICALLRTFYGFDAYLSMHDRFGVDADEASAVVAWAARTLVRELEKERERSAPQKQRQSARTPARKGREGR